MIRDTKYSEKIETLYAHNHMHWFILMCIYVSSMNKLKKKNLNPQPLVSPFREAHDFDLKGQAPMQGSC